MREYVSKRYVALQSRDFRLYLISQFISFTGNQMQFVAINWHVYELTGSAAALGFIGLARFVPILCFSLFGGAVADTFNRKNVQYITSLILGVLATILAWLTWSNSLTTFHIYIFTMLSAATVAFELPARQAFVPSLVKKEHLANATTINVAMWNTVTILGPAIAGIIIAHYNVGTVYAINAVSFAAILIGLFFIRTAPDSQQRVSAMSWKAVVDGFHFVRGKTILWSTMLIDFFSTLFASATSLLPIFAKDILHVGPDGMGLLYSAQSLGALLAGMTVAHFGMIKNQGKLLLLGVMFYAIGTIIFGVSSIFSLSFIALMIVGGGDSISTIIRHTLRQVETPDYLRGRMTAINTIFVLGGPQLGEFEAGILAAAVGAPISVVIGGFCTLAVVAIVYSRIPKLREYQHS